MRTSGDSTHGRGVGLEARLHVEGWVIQEPDGVGEGQKPTGAEQPMTEPKGLARRRARGGARRTAHGVDCRHIVGVES